MENKLEKNNDLWEKNRQNTEVNRMKTRKSLERFLEGWTVRETLTADGSIRRERIYIGDYYSTADTKKQRILRKIVYVLLFIASVALFAVCAVQPTRANYMGYVGLMQGVALLAVIWVLCSLFTYITSPAEMTVGDYKSGVLALKRSSFCMALSFALPALATLVHLFIDASTWGRELVSIFGYLVSGGIIVLVYLAEKKLVYNKRPSPDKNWAAGDEENED